jgi:hypothetical protein
MSHLPTTYKSLSNILTSRLIPHADEIVAEDKCGFGRNRSTTDQIFFIHQLMGKIWSILIHFTNYL